MNEGSIVYRTRVYITDLNAYGKAHFIKYFEWEQKAQEEMLRQNMDMGKIMDDFSKMEMITLEADTVYLKSAHLFDEIFVKVKIGKVMEYSFQFIFEVINNSTGELLSTGGKKVGFKDRGSGKVIRLPDNFREALLNVNNKE